VGALLQTDYLKQVLEPQLKSKFEYFGLVTAELRCLQKLMEDGNPTHDHKFANNLCALYRGKYGLQLPNHLSTSPDLNAVRKC